MESGKITATEVAKSFLCGKCSHYAEQWQQTADKLWAEDRHFTPNFKNYKSDYEK